MKNKQLKWLGIASAILVGCSDPVSGGVQAIVGGNVDAASDAVLLVGHQINGGEMCSAFLITPDVLLTARHCLTTDAQQGAIICEGENATRRTQVVRPADVLVALADDLNSGEFEYLEVAEVLSVPDAATRAMCGNDLIAVRLMRPTTVTPLLLDVQTAPVVGQALSVIGFGNSVAGDGDTAGTRRRRDGVMVTAVGRTLAGAAVRTTDAELVVDIGPCAGDSGSPALNSSGVAVALMSRGNQRTCTSMIYESLVAHGPWLRELARASAERLSIAVPVWAAEATPDAGALDASVADATTSDSMVSMDTSTDDAGLSDSGSAFDGAAEAGNSVSEPAGGCSVGGRPSWWWTLLVLVVLRRRR